MKTLLFNPFYVHAMLPISVHATLPKVVHAKLLITLNHITQIESYFVIREKSRLQYEVIKNQNTNHNSNGILADQIIKLTGYASSGKYPGELRRIVFYAESLNHTYVYLTNNIEAPAYQIALLYKYRWHVELFESRCLQLL